MDCCKSPQCQGIESIFDDAYAKDELENYRRKGAPRQTRMLIEAALASGVEGASLLDIGGGVGAIQHELARAGLHTIVNVDAAPAYLQVARQQAEELGYADRASYYAGNFLEIAPQLEAADIVTLDRVICCFDDMPALVQASLNKARRLYGLVFPVDTWYLKVGRAAFNAFQRITGDPFRVFTHSTQQVDDLIRAAGFEPIKVHRGWIWQVRVYRSTGLSS